VGMTQLCSRAVAQPSVAFALMWENLSVRLRRGYSIRSGDVNELKAQGRTIAFAYEVSELWFIAEANVSVKIAVFSIEADLPSLHICDPMPLLLSRPVQHVNSPALHSPRTGSHYLNCSAQIEWRKNEII
jgi:hypothetical protein